MSNVYAAFFLGQGGYIFSLGVPRLAWRAQDLGVETDVYGYTEVDRANTNISAKVAAGRKIALIGYSLGCTTATYLQTYISVSLVCCIAESTLAQNHPINHKRTKRSVLFHGPDFLSSAGLDGGFDQVIQVNQTHLLMDFSKQVIDGVVTELSALKRD